MNYKTKLLEVMEEKKNFLVEIEIEEKYKEKYYEYCSTVEGLSQWFVEDAEKIEEKIYKLIWNQQIHYAKIIKQKVNKYIKFEFLNENLESVPNPTILDFSFQKNEMTETWYFVVDEYSDFQETQQEFEEDWQELAKQLEEIIAN